MDPFNTWPLNLFKARKPMRAAIFSALAAFSTKMITGRRAFEGKSQLSVFTSILEKDPEPIRASQPLVHASAGPCGACMSGQKIRRIAFGPRMTWRWICAG